ncbi:protein MIS12 homolog [Formica exsecta]|uniref:protein MIS12 homolog n=1 Tax=Formica exsecta TaxID=72781 RepID=UPI001144E6CB|nr:protein MIS12 homolog [Formica exsecta]
MSEPTVHGQESDGRSAGAEDTSRVSSDPPPVMKNTVSESRKRKREEYEMQLFGFHSRAVYATFKSIVMKNIQSKTRRLCEALEDHKSYSENLATLKMNKEQLIKAYYTASLPHLMNIKNIVNKFIAVPNNVLADEDKLQSIQYTKAEFVNMRKKLEEFQQRAKRATVLNAALKEELQLTEQCLIHVDNNDRLTQIIENGVAEIKMAHPNIRNKMDKLIKDYKQISSCFNDGAFISQKSLYNTVDDLKCIDYDMDTL